MNLVPPDFTYEECYRTCQAVCTHDNYKDLLNVFRECVRSHLEQYKRTSRSHSCIAFWKVFDAKMGLISSVFLHLHLKEDLKKLSIDLFLEIAYTTFDDELKWLLDSLGYLRENRYDLQSDQMKFCIDSMKMHHDVGIFEGKFHDSLRQSIEEYFNMLAAEWIANLRSGQVSFRQYLSEIKYRLENELGLPFFDSEMRDFIKNTMINVFVIYSAAAVVKHYPGSIVGDQASLHLFYWLFESNHDIIDKPAAELTKFIVNEGNKLIQQYDLKLEDGKQNGKSAEISREAHAELLDGLLDLKKLIDSIVAALDFIPPNTGSLSLKIIFKDPLRDSLATAVKLSFEEVVNKKANIIAQQIAKFLDTHLRRAGATSTSSSFSQNTDEQLDGVFILFKYLDGKDMFEAHYKKALAKRLIFSKSADNDSEKLMLNRLKTECGALFTNKLEGMFKDIELSKEITSSFKKSKVYAQKRNKFDFNALVLTDGLWPTEAQSSPAKIPALITETQKEFKEYYDSKYSGRRLNWMNHLSHCVLTARFASASKELQLSVHQAVVLLCFNDHEELMAKTIQEKTNIETEELERILQSLALGKDRILKKASKSKQVAPEDLFTFNNDFKSPRHRIKINTIQQKQTVDEDKVVTERVFLERQYVVDAAVTRIMKSRKKLSLSALFNETVQICKFPMTLEDLKKRIDSLVDREYLSVDGRDETMYHYVA